LEAFFHNFICLQFMWEKHFSVFSNLHYYYIIYFSILASQSNLFSENLLFPPEKPFRQTNKYKSVCTYVSSRFPIMKLSLPQSRKSTCPIIKVLSRKGAATFSSWKCCKILFTDNPNLYSYLYFFSQCIFICIVEVYNYKHCTNPYFKLNSCYLFSGSFFHTGAIFAS